MTAKNMSRRLALLAAVLSLLMLLSFAVIPGFAEGTAEPTEVATGEAAVEPTEAATGDDATEPSEENTAETSAATSAVSSPVTSVSYSGTTFNTAVALETDPVSHEQSMCERDPRHGDRRGRDGRARRFFNK